MTDTDALPGTLKHSGLKIILTLVGLALFLTPAVLLASPVDMTINDFRQAGWHIVSKTEHDKWHDGIAPYEDLRRFVYTAVYTLQKDDKTVTCTLARDVMYDTFEQSCSKAKQNQ